MRRAATAGRFAIHSVRTSARTRSMRAPAPQFEVTDCDLKFGDQTLLGGWRRIKKTAAATRQTEAVESSLAQIETPFATVEAAGPHTTVLETGVQTHMGTGRFGRASRCALC